MAAENDSRRPRRLSGRKAPVEQLGIYVDDVYSVTNVEGVERLATDRSFMLFAAEVASHFGALVVFGRRSDAGETVDHLLPEGTQFVELPFYTDLLELGSVAAAGPGTARAMWSGLDLVDAVWVFGPHPLGLLLVAMALLRRKPVVLGVRSDTAAYYRSRLSGRRAAAAGAAATMLDGAYRLLARGLPLTVVGTDLARGYPGPRVLPMTVSLVREQDLGAPPERDWSGRIALLSVGRLDREKNPLLLVELMQLLESAEPGRFQLHVAGTGPLAGPLEAAAEAAGVGENVRLLGYVPSGDRLLDLYRRAHVFVHVSLTEGVPQVLVEAFAAGAAVVATDVGGVGAAADDGGAALLVPPGRPDELARAVRALVEDAELRGRLVRRGLELADELTLERQARSTADFIARSL
jgi:glycosyltransferase involved in cell wall biosynthesis